MKNKFRYLITGGAGFIGSHLVSALIKKGHYVKVFDNFSNSSKENLNFLTNYNNKYYDIIEGDLRNKEDCNIATKNCDYILHQAAIGSVPRSLKEPELYEENNIKGTLNLFLAAKKNNIKKIVQASSSSVYGDTPTLPKIETMSPNPKSPYALSKVACEYYGSIFTNSYNLPVISLRYFNVFGPKQNPHSEYAAVIPLFIKALLNNKSPIIFGNGKQTRDFTYIDNVVDANINSCFANKNAEGKVYNIGGNSNISINELAKKIKKKLNSNIDFKYRPKRIGDVNDSLADITLSKRNLNYDNKISIDEGLELTLQWFKENLKK